MSRILRSRSARPTARRTRSWGLGRALLATAPSGGGEGRGALHRRDREARQPGEGRGDGPPGGLHLLPDPVRCGPPLGGLRGHRPRRRRRLADRGIQERAEGPELFRRELPQLPAPVLGVEDDLPGELVGSRKGTPRRASASAISVAPMNPPRRCAAILSVSNRIPCSTAPMTWRLALAVSTASKTASLSSCRSLW